MIVFRVEVNTPDSRRAAGPYANNRNMPWHALYVGLQDGIAGNDTGPEAGKDRQPLALEDELLSPQLQEDTRGFNEGMYCFKSIAQYHSWFFRAEGRKLAAPYGKLVVLDVPDHDVLVGSAQCIALPTGRVVTTLPLDYEGDYHA